VHMLDPFL